MKQLLIIILSIISMRSFADNTNIVKCSSICLGIEYIISKKTDFPSIVFSKLIIGKGRNVQEAHDNLIDNCNNYSQYKYSNKTILVKNYRGQYFSDKYGPGAYYFLTKYKKSSTGNACIKKAKYKIKQYVR